jgi:predicted AlkP superfamily pyrophosphatase or phosphodiesterase
VDFMKPRQHASSTGSTIAATVATAALAILIATILVSHPSAEDRRAGASSSAGAAPARQDARDVRLVLFVMIDQFRYDYLTRFDSAYSGGLRRLLTDGAVFANAYLEHYPTVTAPGHSTLTTGAMLSTSGIIGNDWFDRESGAQVTSVSDEGVRQLGGTAGAKGGASPHRLLVSTVSDELKMAARAAGAPASRVIGMSLKDRGAILPAGRGADAAYWFDTASGQFVSSTYYFSDLPAWVKQFNDRKIADSYASKPWPGLTGAATPRVLPAAPGAELYGAVFGSPFGNDLLARFAEQALDAESLGQRDGAVDVLSVSFSSNDSVGHAFGPDSPEVRAVSIDVDRTLGQLLAAVDRRVGLAHTLVVLSADHGVAPLPEVLEGLKLPGGRLAQDALFGPIQKALETRFGAGKWIQSTAGSSPYFNYTLMAERGVDVVEARRVAAQAAAAIPHVARVYTRDQLLEGRVPSDLFSQRVLRSFNPRRSGDLEILLDPYWIRQTAGTTHGSPYDYDAHIPLIFMGHGIRAGRYLQAAAMNDVAPTVAAWLQVTPPAGSVGRVLVEMRDERAAAPDKRTETQTR